MSHNEEPRMDTTTHEFNDLENGEPVLLFTD